MRAALFERLTPVNKDPILRLKAMSPEGLRDAVCKPLQLAGEVDDKAGEDDYGRLVSVGATHAELAHDALITQWPWLQGMLKTNTADVRRLARLMERAKEWSAAPDERKAGYLATGAEREAVGELARRRPDWLSQVDRDFVEESNRAFEIEREKEQRAGFPKSSLIPLARLK